MQGQEYTEKTADNQEPATVHAEAGAGGNGVDHGATDAAEAAHAELRDQRLSLVAAVLLGDLRDDVLELIRDLRSPWHKLSESQQTYTAQRVEDRCRQLISETVNLVAARDFTAIPVSLEQVSFKPKGIEAKLILAAISHEVRHALVDAQGHAVMIVVADPKAFMGARGPAKIDKQALFDAPPLDAAEPAGDAVGPLFAGAEAVAEPHEEAYRTGREDCLSGNIDHAARFAPGIYGRADYWRGNAEARAEREAALEEARALGAIAGKSGADKSTNPYPEGTAEHDLWLAGWIAPEPGNNGGHVDEEPAAEPAADPPARRRGRPRRTGAAAA